MKQVRGLINEASTLGLCTGRLKAKVFISVSHNCGERDDNSGVRVSKLSLTWLRPHGFKSLGWIKIDASAFAMSLSHLLPILAIPIKQLYVAHICSQAHISLFQNDFLRT